MSATSSAAHAAGSQAGAALVAVLAVVLAVVLSVVGAGTLTSGVGVVSVTVHAVSANKLANMTMSSGAFTDKSFKSL